MDIVKTDELLAKLEELENYYLELAEATPTRDLDPDPVKARVKEGLYFEFGYALNKIITEARKEHEK